MAREGCAKIDLKAGGQNRLPDQNSRWNEDQKCPESLLLEKKVSPRKVTEKNGAPLLFLVEYGFNSSSRIASGVVHHQGQKTRGAVCSQKSGMRFWKKYPQPLGLPENHRVLVQIISSLPYGPQDLLRAQNLHRFYKMFHFVDRLGFMAWAGPRPRGPCAQWKCRIKKKWF